MLVPAAPASAGRFALLWLLLSASWLPAAERVVLRINAGGGEHRAAAGPSWMRDRGATTGLTTTSRVSAIARTEADLVYRTERYDVPGGGELKYRLPVPDGRYVLRLHFAETHPPAQRVRARVFNVKAEGRLVLANFDIFAEAGANRALIKSIPIVIDDGRLDLEFFRIIQNPKINGIELVAEAGGGKSPGAPRGFRLQSRNARQVTLSWQAPSAGAPVVGYEVRRDGVKVGSVAASTLKWSDRTVRPGNLHHYQLFALAAGGRMASTPELAVRVPAATSGSDGKGSRSAVLRINAGGAAFVDPGGARWESDRGFDSGRTSSTARSVAIAGTKADALYRTQRYQPNRKTPLRYRCPVPNGDYQLRLHFAENHAAGKRAGARRFDVHVEGKRALEGVDIFREVGAHRALIRSMPVTIKDGRLDLEFRSRVHQAVVSGIELLPAADAAEEPAPGIVLAWEDQSHNEAGFHVERSNDGKRFSRVATLDRDVTTFVDRAVESGRLYWYRVRAFNAYGNSGYSNVTKVSIP